MRREVRFWCLDCLDKTRLGRWIKNETPAKCDGKPEHRTGNVVLIPAKECDKQAAWVLIEDL